MWSLAQGERVTCSRGTGPPGVIRSRVKGYPIQYQKNLLPQTNLEMEYKIYLMVPKCEIFHLLFYTLINPIRTEGLGDGIFFC